MRLMIGALALCLSGACAQAGDFGPLNAVNETFNRAAKSFGADARMLLVTCSDAKKACQYSISGNMTGIAKAEDGSKGKTGTIAIFYGKNSGAQDFVVALGVSMAAWSPKADKAERGLALSSLVDAVSGDSPKEIVLDGTKYRLVSIKDEGLVVLTMNRV